MPCVSGRAEMSSARDAVVVRAFRRECGILTLFNGSDGIHLAYAAYFGPFHRSLYETPPIPCNWHRMFSIQHQAVLTSLIFESPNLAVLGRRFRSHKFNRESSMSRKFKRHHVHLSTAISAPPWARCTARHAVTLLRHCGRPLPECESCWLQDRPPYRLT